MLGVVEQEQQPGFPDQLGRFASSLAGKAERSGHRLGHRGRVLDGGEVDETDAVGKAGPHFGGELQGEAGLPAAAGTGQGHQAGPAENPLQVLDLAAPAYERAERPWQWGERKSGAVRPRTGRSALSSLLHLSPPASSNPLGYASWGGERWTSIAPSAADGV